MVQTVNTYTISSRPSRVLGCLRGRSLRRNISLGQSAIHNKIGSIDKAALVTSEEDNSMSLLDRLTKSPSREMHLPTEPLRLVITKPVLKKGRAKQRSATETIR